MLLLAPSSSILPAADLAADRRMYLPMVAFCACAGVLLEAVDRRAIVAIVLGLIAISIRYSILWTNPEALWSEAGRLAPDAVRPRIQLARALPPEQALEELKDAPDNENVATERGRLLLTLGRPAEALSAFGRALALSPNDATSHQQSSRGVGGARIARCRDRRVSTGARKGSLPVGRPREFSEARRANCGAGPLSVSAQVSLSPLIDIPHRLVNLLPLRFLIKLRAHIELTVEIRGFLPHLPII